MAEINRRRAGEWLRVLFSVLIAQPDGVAAGEAIRAVEAQVKLTDYERSEFPSGGRRFDKILRFSSVDCVKAGWLVKDKGRWSLTDDGKAAYARFKDPEEFFREANKLYRQWKASQVGEVSDGKEVADKEEVKETSVTYEEAEEKAWGEIEQYLAVMHPYEFQELVADLLRAMEYYVGWIAPPGKDGGVDIIAGSDPLGTKPPRIKVQVKRQGDSVRVDGVRSFLANLGDDDVGLFVCTGGFSKDAAETARSQERRRMTLIDSRRLIELWIEHYQKLSDEARQRLTLKPIYFLAPPA